jgi:hypothetical protein
MTRRHHHQTRWFLKLWPEKIQFETKKVSIKKVLRCVEGI